MPCCCKEKEVLENPKAFSWNHCISDSLKVHRILFPIINICLVSSVKYTSFFKKKKKTLFLGSWQNEAENAEIFLYTFCFHT